MVYFFFVNKNILELPKYKEYRDVSEELENWIKFIESPGNEYERNKR